MTTLDRAQRQQTQFPDTLRYQLNSQIYIINSEDVLRQAISEFGPRKLFPDQRKSVSWHVLECLAAGPFGVGFENRRLASTEEFG